MLWLVMKTKVPGACNDAERTQTLDQFQQQRHFAPTLLTGQREESSSPVESAINEFRRDPVHWTRYGRQQYRQQVSC